MTNEQKKRTWWVTNEFWPKANEQHYAFNQKPDVKQYGETFEVVQLSEYLLLQKQLEERDQVRLWNENEELRKMIEVLNDENKLHIKLLEKINDWATAGNIDNYSQLCDELEKIQEDEK